jgi:hypothetical protein
MGNRNSRMARQFLSLNATLETWACSGLTTVDHAQEARRGEGTDQWSPSLMLTPRRPVRATPTGLMSADVKG